jgi:hypothetical protein
MKINKKLLILVLLVTLVITFAACNISREREQKQVNKEEASDKDIKVNLSKNEKLAMRVIARPNKNDKGWHFVLQKVKLPKDNRVLGGVEEQAKAGLERDKEANIEVLSENFFIPFVWNDNKSDEVNKLDVIKMAQKYTESFNID